MPIANIRDSRRNPHAWKKVYGVVEPTCHDNILKGADRVDNDCKITVEYMGNPAHLSEVIKWANSFEGHITLFIYDSNPGEPKAVKTA